MKRILMYLMSLGFLCPSLTAQPMAIQHISGAGADNSYSVSHDLTRSASGELYMAGEFKGEMMMPDSTYSSSGLFTLQTPDGFITKYASDGSYQWTFPIGSEIFGKVNQVHFQEGVGCWALINSMNGTVIDSLNFSHAGEFLDIVILISEEGELLFHQTIEAEDGISDLHFTLGEFDDLYFTGLMDGDLQVGGYTLDDGNGPPTGFVLRMLSDGTVSWGQLIGNQNMMFGHPAAGAQGEVYVTGKLYADSQIPAKMGTQVITQETVHDFFLARFDSTGALEWVHTSPDASAAVTPSAAGWAAKYASSGHVYVTGEFAGTSLDLDGVILTNEHSGKDFFLAKFSSNGTIQWAVNNRAMSQAARGRELAIGDQGEVFVQGTYGVGTQGGFSMELGIGGNKIILAPTADEDVFQAAYSSAGILLWAEGGNGYSDDFSGGIAATGNGQAVFSGGFQDTLLLPDTMLVATPDLISTNAYLTWSGGSSTSIADQLETADHWRAYPNPVSSILYVSDEEWDPQSKWQLIDSQGRILKKANGQLSDFQWDVSELPSGLFFLQRIRDGKHSTRSIMVR